ETRFQADAGAQWEPAGAGVSFIDSRGLGLVAFDLRADEPVRIDFEAMGFEVSSVEAHAWGAGVLAFVVPGAEAPVIALYDLEAGELSELPLPEGMQFASALQRDPTGSTLFFLGYRVVDGNSIRRPLYKTMLDADGVAGPVVALGAGEAESFTTYSVLASGDVIGLGATSPDALHKRQRLFRW